MASRFGPGARKARSCLVFASQYSSSARGGTSNLARATIVAGTTFVAVGALIANDDVQNGKVSLSALPTSGDVVNVGNVTKEQATGIPFPSLCNGMSLAGTGVRIKYVFVKVYAVGTYFDPIAMMAVKKSSKDTIEKALLDPTYPR